MSDITFKYGGNTVATMDASGTATINTAGNYCEGNITVEYNKTAGTAGTPVATKGTVSNNSISVTPSVTNTTGYITGGTITGTAVAVSASELVSGTKTITSAGTTDVTNYASASVASGTEGTPVATKGSVSSNSISITPSVTNVGGFINGGTHTGTAVTVAASELVSGTKSITSAGTTDVTNYASASVASGSATTPATSITANPSISVNSSGLITASVSASKSVTPTVSAGYVSSGTSGTVSVSGSNTSQLTTQGATTITPTEQSQTAVSSGKFTTGAITVNPIPSQYIIPTGTVSITSNGTVDVSQYSNADVNVPTSPVSSISNDVNFFDYDGTIVASYTASDFANLTELPSNPSHDGLTAQGWNWTLTDAKAVVAKSGFLDIGQMYVTSDGKTRIYISLFSSMALSPQLRWNQTVAKGVVIDWGDGSSTTSVSGTGNKSANHTYSAVGNYIITITVVSGTMKLGNGSSGTATVVGALNSSSYRASVTRVNIGSNVTEITAYAFYQNANLSAISMPNTITSIGNYAFQTCQFPFVVIPSSCTTLGTYVFDSCKAIRYISIPNSVTSFGNNDTYSCTGLRRALLAGITSIGTNTFAYNYGTFIMWFGSSLSSIGDNAFRSLSGCAEYHFTSTTPPTLGTTPFNGIASTANTKIYVPSASLSNYQSAWSSVASYLVGE